MCCSALVPHVRFLSSGTPHSFKERAKVAPQQSSSNQVSSHQRKTRVGSIKVQDVSK